MHAARDSNPKGFDALTPEAIDTGIEEWIDGGQTALCPHCVWALPKAGPAGLSMFVGLSTVDMTSRGPRWISLQYQVQGFGLSLLAAYLFERLAEITCLRGTHSQSLGPPS
jgi:hypothetical protein